MAKVRYLKEIILFILTCSLMLLGPMQDIIVPQSSLSSSSDYSISISNSGGDLKSCFQSFTNAFNYQLKCTRQAVSGGPGQQQQQQQHNSAINIFLGCLETALKSMNHPSCTRSKVLQNGNIDPPTMLSLYQNTTVVFPQEDSEMCNKVQDDLDQIGLVTMHAIVPEGFPRRNFFGCKLFVHDVLMCCT